LLERKKVAKGLKGVPILKFLS